MVTSSSPMTTHCRFNGNSLGISWQLDGNSLVSQSGIPTGIFIGPLLASQSQLKPMTSIIGPMKFCYLGGSVLVLRTTMAERKMRLFAHIVRKNGTGFTM